MFLLILPDQLLPLFFLFSAVVDAAPSLGQPEITTETPAKGMPMKASVTVPLKMNVDTPA